MKILCIAKKQRNTPFEQLPVDSTHHENYVRAIQFIDRHYQEDIHLTDIAKTLSFSTSYTSRLFTRYIGLSFVKYLSYVRVRESLEDLLEGKASIEEISENAGCQTPRPTLRFSRNSTALHRAPIGSVS